ncbi:MAG: hypothetical protein AAGA77_01055 [Bacteroidota bacterium]
MKKFLSSIILFIPFSLILYVVLICLWGSNLPTRHRPNLIYKLGHWGHIYSRLQEAKTYRDVDILFLGSSHSYRGFDVRKFDSLGLKTFNMGTGAQTPIQTKALLKRYLPKMNPKTIIYEVSPILFSYEPVESSLDLIANDVNDWNTMEMVFSINHIKTYNTAIYAMYRDALNLNKDFKENASRADDLYIPGGYVQKRMKRYKYRKHNKKERKPRSIQVNAFYHNVQMIKDKEINLILVQTPITQSLYKAHTSNKLFDKQMKELAPYYNFNELIQLDDSIHFYDSHHLNQDGVEVFNDSLIMRLGL